VKGSVELCHVSWFLLPRVCLVPIPMPRIEILNKMIKTPLMHTCERNCREMDCVVVYTPMTMKVSICIQE